MLHTDLSISSTPKARAQRLRSPGCPQLHTTNDSPLQGPCHLSDPSFHSELAFDTNGITEHLWPCVQPLFPKLPKQTLQPCWPPCCSEHACQVSSHLAIFALLVPSTWNAIPQLSCMLALSHQNVSILTLPHYLPFLFPYPALNLPITFVPHWIGCNFVSWHVVDAQWICEEWINEKLNSIPHFLTASAVYSHQFKDMECNW